jgi:hypothetical protein
MSRWYSLLLAFVLVLCGFSAQARDYERLLKGDYAFAGEAVCLISINGFNPDLTPVGPPAPFPQILSFSVQGVRTFNGDGTGTVTARVMSISHPFALPTSPTPVFNRGAAASVDIESDFTYTVSPDLKVSITTPVINGTVLTGPRAGQTQTITNLPEFTGYISEDLQSLTLAHEVPGIEIHTFSNGDSSQRICHRARILHERKSNKHRGHHRHD